MKHEIIPYGVCEVNKLGDLKYILEKPYKDMLVNVGFYVIEKECLSIIPKNGVFNMTDLIECLLRDDKKVSVFPISEGRWIDIGQWDEYRSVLKILD